MCIRDRLTPVTDVIIPAKFYVDPLMGFWEGAPPKVSFSILFGTTVTTVLTTVQTVILHYRADCDLSFWFNNFYISHGFFFVRCVCIRRGRAISNWAWCCSLILGRFTKTFSFHHFRRFYRLCFANCLFYAFYLFRWHWLKWCSDCNRLTV